MNTFVGILFILTLLAIGGYFYAKKKGLLPGTKPVVPPQTINTQNSDSTGNKP